MSELKEFELAVEVMFDKTKEQLTKIVNTNNTIKEKISGIYAQQRKLNEDINEIKRLVEQQTTDQLNKYCSEEPIRSNDLDEETYLAAQQLDFKIKPYKGEIAQIINVKEDRLLILPVIFPRRGSMQTIIVKAQNIIEINYHLDANYEDCYTVLFNINQISTTGTTDYDLEADISKETYEFLRKNLLKNTKK